MLYELYHMSLEPPLLKEAEDHQAWILDADYSRVDIDEYVQMLNHLNESEQEQVAQTFKKFPELFSGRLGLLKVKPIHLELHPNATPYHAKPFCMPVALEATTCKEVACLTSIGAFCQSYDSEWAAPTFIQPKKTGDVCILTDFCKLNAALAQKPFPLPKISNVLQQMQEFTYATALDLSMGYYHIPLDEESACLCTTIFPWGNYQYLRLPMGVKKRPNIFQAIISELLGDMEGVHTYLDDILITTSSTLEHHLQVLESVLAHLEAVGFHANLCKCYFAKQELEYLGYILTQTGIQPQPKKVEAIMHLQPPMNKHMLRHLLGLVNYYQ